ncbi:uncharacterized protein LOC106723267 [Alligator sinensis]|uniref:Uncharacterized protein LOC106723267 n=1 Tax=Alligator sinensis TaxID=38654 RepID=A0A3Q0FTV5_ALLSI|nr:uncharacterized protein LOC106723267 [Alligator sinensis]
MEGTFPEDMAVTWERIHSEDRTVPESAGDQESPEHQPLFPALPPGWRVTEERAGTRLTSSLTFTPTLQDDGARVRCVFLHEAKRIREERVSPEIRGHLADTPLPPVAACRPRPPHLGEVSHPQALVPGQPETLRCRISGFYPGQLAVTWLRKGAGEKAPRPLESSDPHRMHTPAPSPAPDGKSYSVESELRLPPAGPEDAGVEYLCRMQHEALREPESRSSGWLWVQGPPGDSYSREEAGIGASDVEGSVPCPVYCLEPCRTGACGHLLMAMSQAQQRLPGVPGFPPLSCTAQHRHREVEHVRPESFLFLTGAHGEVLGTGEGSAQLRYNLA